jgi:hypothetical protein
VSKTRKGDPIPAKFDPPEESLILRLADATGLSQSEIIRRATRLLGREIQRQGDGWLSFLNNLRRGTEPRISEEPSQPYGERTEIFHHERPPAERPKPRAKKKRKAA